MFSSSFKSASLFLFAALPAVLGATFDVSVGGLGTDVFKFTPDTVTAAQGDIVRFIFKQKNHTVTQVTFDNPCTQAPGGFDSGFIPVPQDQTDNFQTAEFRVEDATRPTWVMCRPHCRSQGMVFAINPGERMAAFKAAATGAAAPTGSTTGTAATPSSTAAAKDIKVIVGGTGVLAFNPSNVQANIGDRIIFEFHQKNHSVVASTFEQPCVPLSAAAGGWNSGYFPVSDTDTVFPTYSVVVNDTKPVWAYCSQGNHCGQGMVFSINAVEGSAKSFSAFQDLAKSINGTGAGTGGYGNSGAMSTTMNGAGVLLATLLAVAALL